MIELTRRKYLSSLAAAPVAAAAAAALPGDAGRERRMKWWHQARFGMFIHWGLYSVLGRHEWAMEEEGIPVAEYEQLAKQFRPAPGAQREWARLAKRTGQKYMVMTAKHHEGFCLFDTRTTDYCAPKHGPARDLVAEYVEAVRAEGLRVGFYFSPMDWHHPDGALCATDPAARRRFVDYVHAQIRELMTNYGKIDVLWYDMNWPLDVNGWESEKMNRMVFELQPDIVVNNRNGLEGDFSTPEQEIPTSRQQHAWESCMTMNESWGYHRADVNWKTANTIARNLARCSNGAGNYLLNVGPKPDGSVPEESVRVLDAVGPWLARNAEAIYGTEPSRVGESLFSEFTRKGNTLYAHIYFWPGETVSFGGIDTKVVSARLLASGEKVRFDQDRFRVRLSGLPAQAPDTPLTVIALECASEPVQNLPMVRKERPRGRA